MLLDKPQHSGHGDDAIHGNTGFCDIAIGTRCMGMQAMEASHKSQPRRGNVSDKVFTCSSEEVMNVRQSIHTMRYSGPRESRELKQSLERYCLAVAGVVGQTVATNQF